MFRTDLFPAIPAGIHRTASMAVAEVILPALDVWSGAVSGIIGCSRRSAPAAGGRLMLGGLTGGACRDVKEAADV